jgi:hypothetical protein
MMGKVEAEVKGRIFELNLNLNPNPNPNPNPPKDGAS